MQRIVFTIKTKLLAPDDDIQLALGYGDNWFPLVLAGVRGGWRAVHDLPDEIDSCDVVLEVNGPAYALIRVFALIPSGSNLGPIVEHSITAQEAFTPVRAVGVLEI